MAQVYAPTARGQTLRVEGLDQFLRAVGQAEKQTKKEVRSRLREAADVVRVEASKRFAPKSARSAAGYRTIVRTRGISVEQSLRRSKNPAMRRPQWAELQITRALEPALDAKGHELEGRMEKALDELADVIEGRAFA